MPDALAGNPAGLGLHPGRLALAYDRLDALTRDGTVPAVAVCLGRRGGMLATRGFGAAAPTPGAPPLPEDALFLVASLTKPVTAVAAVRLVERGELGLDDRVAESLPEFGQAGKHDVRVRHLLTHTSGLPDMPPNNRELRARHATSTEFLAEVCRLPLAFVPGTRVSYQSMGFATLAGVIERVAGVPLPDFLRTEVFQPLGMADTRLGWDPVLDAGRMTAVRLEGGQPACDWDWNSDYWRAFGAPWGGLVSTPADLGRLCRMMLHGGALDGARVLSPAAVRAMTTNQLEGFPTLPEFERRCRGWGLGWRLSWPGHSAHFGDLLGPRTFGHWGATGTLMWADPDADAFLVLLTTQPGGDEGRHLARASNLFAAAFE